MTTEELDFRQCFEQLALFFVVVDDAVGCDSFGEVFFEVVFAVYAEDLVGFDFGEVVVSFSVGFDGEDEWEFVVVYFGEDGEEYVFSGWAVTE